MSAESYSCDEGFDVNKAYEFFKRKGCYLFFHKNYEGFKKYINDL